MQLCPASIAQVPLTALEAWLGTALNTAAGALFVAGSYAILAGMYGSFAPQRALLGPQARTLNFWGSASYLLVKLCLAEDPCWELALLPQGYEAATLHSLPGESDYWGLSHPASQAAQGCHSTAGCLLSVGQGRGQSALAWHRASCTLLRM